MQKELTISEFTDELIDRIEKKKSIDCCMDEIKNLAQIAKKCIPDETIMVTWKD